MAVAYGIVVLKQFFLNELLIYNQRTGQNKPTAQLEKSCSGHYHLINNQQHRFHCS
jgi:hypothetical protein